MRTNSAGHDGKCSRDINIRTTHEEILPYELRKELVRYVSAVIRQDFNLSSEDQDVACYR